MTVVLGPYVTPGYEGTCPGCGCDTEFNPLSRVTCSACEPKEDSEPEQGTETLIYLVNFLTTLFLYVLIALQLMPPTPKVICL